MYKITPTLNTPGAHVLHLLQGRGCGHRDGGQETRLRGRQPPHRHAVGRGEFNSVTILNILLVDGCIALSPLLQALQCCSYEYKREQLILLQIKLRNKTGDQSQPSVTSHYSALTNHSSVTSALTNHSSVTSAPTNHSSVTSALTNHSSFASAQTNHSSQ